VRLVREPSSPRPARRTTTSSGEGATARVRAARAYRALQDGQLVALVAERDGGALDALYDRYGAPMFALARRILSDDTLAATLVKDVFLALWASAGRFDATRGTVGTYLLASTQHRAAEAVRERMDRRAPDRDAAGFEVDPRTYLEPDLRQPADRDLDRAQRAARIRAALDDLPESQRHLLGLAYFGGYTQREVAALVGEPLPAVQTGMAAAMRGLRDAIMRRERARPRNSTSR
jgi:RNA polymerase sigma factor (sigma-70 family)